MSTHHSKPTLTYFSTRGLAEGLRVVLAEAKIDYEEIGVGTYNKENQPQAFKDILASGILPYNALPIWQEPSTGIRLTQTSAIIRHIARTHGLYGKSEAEMARCDELAEGLHDAVRELRTHTLSGDKEAGKKSAIEDTLPRWLGFYEKILLSNHGGKGFFVGEHPTYVDFLIWYFLEVSADQGLANVHHFPTLHAFKERIEARESIKAHRTHPKRHPVQHLFN